MTGMGDVKAAEARDYGSAHARILDACAQAFRDPANRANCSAFVRSVGVQLGVPVGLTGGRQANDIYDEIQRSPWLLIGHGEAAVSRAVYMAREGFFVVAAWKHPDGGHGHVAVVTDLTGINRYITHPTSRNVLASWGVLDAGDLARNGGRIRETFDVTHKLPQVVYAAQYIRRFQ